MPSSSQSTVAAPYPVNMPESTMEPANADRFGLPKSSPDTRFPQQAEPVLAVKFISCCDIFKLSGDEPDGSDRQQHVGMFFALHVLRPATGRSPSGKELEALATKAGKQMALLILCDSSACSA